jgi:acyl-coenzyme A thioesterase 9
VKTPKDSCIEKVIALSTDHRLREMFVNNWGEVRIGLVLEELDRLAGAVAYKHALSLEREVVSFLLHTPNEDLMTSDKDADSSLPMTIVTASVDSIVLYRPLAIKNDLKIVGRVVLVGRSSMEVLLEVDTINGDKSERAIEAHFTMVARTPGGEKAVTIPDLAPSTDLEIALYKRAQEHRAHRKQSLESSLFMTTPKPEELELLHKLFFNNARSSIPPVPSAGAHSPPATSTNIASANPAAAAAETKLEPSKSSPKSARPYGVQEQPLDPNHFKTRSSVFVMQPQKRNIHNKVFGGYLMRLAFEQAWSSAYIFSGSLPSFIACDDIAFLLPVSLGTLVTFDNTVIFSRQISDGRHEIVVEVKANVLHPAQHTQETTNTFFFFFRVSQCDLQVVPWTYMDSMKWLDGKRRLEAISLSRDNNRPPL